MDTEVGIAAKHLVYRATRAVRLANRLRRRALQQQMACYTSPADRQDLQATLDRYPDSVTQEMRDLLDGQDRQQRSPQRQPY